MDDNTPPSGKTRIELDVAHAEFLASLNEGCRTVEERWRVRNLERANAKMREALLRITRIRWGWDGDCGAVAIAEDALEP